MDEPPEPKTNRSTGQRWSLRAKLTLWFIILFGVLQLVFGTLVVGYQRQSLNRSFDNSLHRVANGLVSSIRDAGPPWERTALEAQARAGQVDLFREQVLLDVFDGDGKLVATSSDAPDGQTYTLEGAADLIDRAADALADVLPRLDADRGDGRPRTRRAVVRSTEARDGKAYLIRVTATSDMIDRSLDLTFRIVLIVVPLSLLAAGIAAWLIIGRALRPLAALADAATHIDAGHVELDAAEPRSAEMARLQRQLSGALRRLRGGYESRDRFISNVAHELKTPIAVILAQAQLMSGTSREDDECDQLVRSVQFEMGRLGGMVDSLLMLARLSDDAETGGFQSISLNETIMAAVDHCTETARPREVQIEPILVDSGDDSFDASEELIVVLMENLIRNAVRFSPANGVVRVIGRADPDQVTVDIDDDGPGIPPELLGRLFEPFARDDVESNRGTGLGLAIARQIAQLHRGSIAAENLDRGSRFTVTVPRRQVSADDDQTAKPISDA